MQVTMQNMQETHDEIELNNSFKNESYVSTKNILLQHPNKKNKHFTFHIPCYVRLQVKNFVSLSLQQLKAKLHTKLMFDIQITNLPLKLQKYLQENIILRFNEDSPLHLQYDDPEIAIKKRVLKGHEMIAYRIRKQLNAKIVPQIFWTPYQILYLITSITLGHMEIEQTGSIGKRQQKKVLIEEFNSFLQKNLKQKRSKKESKFEIRFNIMDYKSKEFEYKNDDEVYQMMSRVLFTNDTSFGNYDLAERLINVQYTKNGNSRQIQNLGHLNNYSSFACVYNFCVGEKQYEKQEQQEKERLLQVYTKRNNDKISPCNHAHFELPIYRRPIVSLVTIFAPLWLLGLISLGVFFQSIDLATRINSIAMIMLGHVAFMPVVRAQLPPSPKMTFVQVLIYLQILITFFCLVQSIRIRDTQQVFIWSQNVLFLLSFVIQILEFLVIVGSAFVYYCYQFPSYNVKRGLSIYFDINDWCNLDCDEHYNSQMKKYNYEIRQLNKLLKND